MSKTNRAILTHFSVLLFVAVLLLTLARFFPIAERIADLQGSLAKMPAVAPLLHSLLLALCNILLLPGGLLAVGAGLLFGVWKGWALNLIGALLAAWVANMIARRFARGFIERRFLQQPRWAALDAAIATEGWRVIFLTQLHPLAPSSLLNYLYGATRVPLAQCLFWTALGQAPGLLLYTYLGSISRTGIEAIHGVKTITASEWLIWLAVIIPSAITLALIARVSMRILEKSGAVEAEKSSANY